MLLAQYLETFVLVLCLACNTLPECSWGECSDVGDRGLFAASRVDLSVMICFHLGFLTKMRSESHLLVLPVRRFSKEWSLNTFLLWTTISCPCHSVVTCHSFNLFFTPFNFTLLVATAIAPHSAKVSSHLPTLLKHLNGIRRSHFFLSTLYFYWQVSLRYIDFILHYILIL